MSASRSRNSEPGLGCLLKRTILLLLLFFVSVPVLVLTAAGAHAQVTLNWTASTSSNVTGYKIHYGTVSTSLGNTTDVGNVTSYTFSGLSTGATYYFEATAYDSSGDQSGDSNEVSYTVPSSCSYTISPTSASFTSTGGTVSVNVTTQSGCTWTAGSAASWMSITSGASGTGSGTVNYSVAANTGTSTLTAASTIAGLSFTVTEAGVQSETITASAGTGGTISPTGSVPVTYGANQTFTVTPNTGYAISSVTVDGASVGAVTSYTFSNVTGNHTIAASFNTVTYSLTVTETGTGTGSVATNPSGTTFASGTSVTLTATASAGSSFTGWSGACSGTSQTCQVVMNGNESVGAAFTATAQDPIITASAGTGGTISPTGSVSVNNGASETFQITAKTGYAISNVTVDGKSVGKPSSYTFSDVTTNHAIKATFTRKSRW